MFEVTDTQKIGVGLAGFGIFFLFLGVVLIFDKSLLALGNILFISGLACVIGRERTFRFFFQRHKVKGSLAFFGGITIVLIGWPFVGMLVETYGFILLFRYSIKTSRCAKTEEKFSDLVTSTIIVAMNVVSSIQVFTRFILTQIIYNKKIKDPKFKLWDTSEVTIIVGFFPVAINFLRRVPILGTFLNFPGVSGLVDKLAGDSHRTTV